MTAVSRAAAGAGARWPDSENVPAVALASELGVSDLLRFFERAGLSTFDRTPAYYGLGLTLGNAEVRLDELVAAYATFARGGIWRRPSPLRGEGGEERHLVSPRTAFWITDILSDPEARAFIFGRGGNLEFPFAVAAKTGTSQAYHDNWTIGYTRDVTVGVWVGNFDRTPLRDSSGVTGAGPIFHAVMLAAERRVGADVASDAGIVPAPADVERTAICSLSGMRAGPSCPSTLEEWTPSGQSGPLCTWHDRSASDIQTRYPAEYRAWAATESVAAAWPAAPGPGGSLAVPDEIGRRPKPARSARLPRELTIASPPGGAVYSVDPTLRREFQAVPLRVVSPQPTTISWFVDGRPVGETSSERSLPWPLVVGTHRIEAHGLDGAAAAIAVVVK